MPDLDWNKRWGEQAKDFQNGDEYFNRQKIYGYQWGDPKAANYSASFVLPEYLQEYSQHANTILEIGPGGGRYSQFLGNCEDLYLVEYNTEFFPILEDLLQKEPCKKHYIASGGAEMPGVPEQSVDFVFSFDCFVHLDEPLIRGYLDEIKRVIKPDGISVIHYADKRKKGAQAQGSNFSDMTPDKMKSLLQEHGFQIVKEDTERISHSAIAAFRLA